jgi:hypothetical protein
MKIIDKNGQWLINRSEYRFVDPDGKIMEPGEETKIISTDWHANQPVLEACVDPTNPDAEIVPKPAAKAVAAPAPTSAPESDLKSQSLKK